MRKLLILATVLIGLSSGLAPSAVAAATVDDCQVQIAALQQETQNATFLGRNADQDRAALLDKLANAQVKLADGKFVDAAAKLTDFRDKVVALGAQGKLDPNDAASLQAGADEAIACVLSLLTT